MLGRVVAPAVVVVSIALTACGGSSGSGTTLPRSSNTTMSLTSAAFANDGAIPKAYTCDGAGTSPPLHWAGVPSDTRQLALVVQDTDAHFLHWLVLKIPVTTTSVASGHVPPSAIQLENDFGDASYGGPCPPKGPGAHHYVFALYALDSPLNLSANASAEDATSAISDHTLARGVLTGTYRRGG
jgi:Raf kinase inhibitor-like YbhB/YbcL family protein